MIGDYEDDAHFCLKCHTTILGLENYVNHRKSGCNAKIPVGPSKSPLPSQLLPPDESFNLKADDFFSSLELQSSSKKPNTQSTSGKNISGILTRSKTGVITSSKREELPQSKSGKNVWIGGHQLKELGHGDNESKLIKAVANLERRKPEEDDRLQVFEESDDESEEYESEVDESSDDEDAPPRNHTGGKWKPSSPIQWNRDWNVPPPTFTGGKWKRNSPPPIYAKGKWKPLYNPCKDNFDVPPPSFTGSKWTPAKARQDIEVPPPTHTKGKWKPPTRSEIETNFPPPEHTKGKWPPTICSEEKQQKPSEVISPNYTKGKWKPDQQQKISTKKEPTKIIDDSPFRKSGGTVQYWCRPCNRHLASKVVYERHLKSELHFKRTLHDKEIDDVVGINLLKDGRRIKKKLPDIVFHDEEKQRKLLLENRKRLRKKIYIHCKVCKSKVNKSLIAKHLYSHYHCKNSDLNNEDTRKMILDNIYSIVLQSPFQCNTCKYYYNTQSDFLKHWLSEDHVKKQSDKPGYFYCSFCKFQSSSNELMYDHLISTTHKDVVAVINYSVPIIIKKINPIVCKICDESFLLNVQFLKHCKAKNHDLIEMNYNSNYVCDKCDHVFQSKIALSRHKRTVHSEQVFVCSICDLSFKNLVEAKVHRRTKEHRLVLLGKRNKTGAERKCMHCEKVFENFGKLKEHLKSDHAEHNPKCPHCSMSFVVPQELTVHIRTNSCRLLSQAPSKANACDKCSYSSDSRSELLFHKALHFEPLVVFPEQGKPIHQYKCLICDKFFAKASLQGHLRLHTKERPFVCNICNAGFVRKNNLLFHVKNHGKRDAKKSKQEETMKLCRGRPFVCSTCGKGFRKKSILQQHMTIHTGKSVKCPKENCFSSFRSVGELEQHFLTHSDVKNFKCSLCEFRTKTKKQLARHLTSHESVKQYQCPQCEFTTRLSSHLKRHFRLHTGAKPYRCPHCDYKCSALENLRRHILSTNKHPGKTVYECKFCSEGPRFQSNFSKEFKLHLFTRHSDTFKDDSAASTYISEIYHPQADVEDDRNACVIILQEHSSGGIKRLKTNSDPVVAGSSSKPSTSKEIYLETNVKNEEEMFTTYTVLKDEDNPSDSWNLVGSYDVEESGTLVNFQTDEENYFIDFE